MHLSARSKRIGLVMVILGLVFSLSACSGKSLDKDSAQPAKESQSKSQEAAGKSADSKSNDGIVKSSRQDQLEKEEQVLVYLEKTVPEVKEFGRNIESYNKDSNTECRLIMRIDSIPDPKASDKLTRDFYYIYVGSNMGTHTSRWNSFYVKSDLSEVLVEDMTGGAPMTPGQWRDVNEGTPSN